MLITVSPGGRRIPGEGYHLANVYLPIQAKEPPGLLWFPSDRSHPGASPGEANDDETRHPGSSQSVIMCLDPYWVTLQWVLKVFARFRTLQR
jgi:hypothetical protein